MQKGVLTTLSKVTLTIVRPYQTIEEFLDNDAWTAGRTDLLLIDQGPVPSKTIVHFRVELGSGQVLFQGDGWPAGHVKPLGGRPGGLRVRFRNIDSASKEMLKKALEALERAQPEDPGDSVAPPEKTSAAPKKNSVPPEVSENPERTGENPEQTGENPEQTGKNPEQSGVHHVVRAPVIPPGNRNELLERLRQRALALKPAPAEAGEPDPERAAG